MAANKQFNLVSAGLDAPVFTTGGSWMGRLQAGDDNQAARLWDHYYSRLVTMAQQQLCMSPQHLADGQDIVVSAFGSFFRAVREDRVNDNISTEELWRLLVTLTARKVIKVVRYESRLKRDIRAVEDGVELDELFCDEPTPELAAAVAQQYQWLSDQLTDDEMRLLVQRKLEGYSNAEIAQQLDCSVRTVKRRLSLTRALLDDAIRRQSDALSP